MSDTGSVTVRIYPSRAQLHPSIMESSATKYKAKCPCCRSLTLHTKGDVSARTARPVLHPQRSRCRSSRNAIFLHKVSARLSSGLRFGRADTVLVGLRMSPSSFHECIRRLVSSRSQPSLHTALQFPRRLLLICTYQPRKTPYMQDGIDRLLLHSNALSHQSRY